MGLSRIRDMVSQAEKEGVSLAVMISREMTDDEIHEAQLELASELMSNYASIKEFMADVEVPSIYEILSRADVCVPSQDPRPSDRDALEGGLS